MPTYVYECKTCGTRSEIVQRVTDDPLTACHACSGELRKVFFPSRVIFKGSGWYITDSKSTSSKQLDGAIEGNGAPTVAETKAAPEKKTEPATPPASANP